MTGRQGKQWQLTGQGASAHSLSWGRCQLCSAANTGRMRRESPNQNKGNLVTLKGNTFTVDNRKSPLFLYSAGTTNHTTQYMSCRTETQVQFLSTIWPSPCCNSAAGKGFKRSFKASTHFISSCLCQLTFFSPCDIGHAPFSDISPRPKGKIFALRSIPSLSLPLYSTALNNTFKGGSDNFPAVTF